MPFREAWSYLIEQLTDHGYTTYHFQSLPTGVQVAALSQRDQLISKSSQLFRLRFSSNDSLMIKEGCG
jgi:hypothetical protein